MCRVSRDSGSVKRQGWMTWLIRSLRTRMVYSRSSRWEGDEPPRPHLFAVAQVRPLTPLQLTASLRVATADPASLPADLKPDEFETRIEGTVRYVRDPMDLAAESEPGMGVKFERLTGEQRELILRFVRKRAPIFYDE